MESTEKLGDEIASLAAHLDAATHDLLELIRRFDEAGGWHEQAALSCAHWLTWRVGWDPATAREKVRVARALGKLPIIDAALRSGALSYAKVRAITRVAVAETEGKFLKMAMYATGAQLERICRGYRSVVEREEGEPRPEERSMRSRRLPGGMVNLELVLEPDEADLILRAVDRAREVSAEERERAKQAARQATPATSTPGASAETPWPSRADGAVRLAESFLAGNPVSGTGGERFQVMVHLDQDVLGADGAWSATLEDGSSVSAGTLRRVACDCGLVAVGQDGEALNIGRRARSIPPAIRRALMLRDRGCAFPGCTHTRFLHAHHIEHWLHGGETKLDNLVMLCTFHHHRVHEGGWTISVESDGAPSFNSPVGTWLTPEPPRERIDDGLAWLRGWAEERGLNLGPEANRPLGEGTKMDYPSAVEALLDG